MIVIEVVLFAGCLCPCITLLVYVSDDDIHFGKACVPRTRLRTGVPVRTIMIVLYRLTSAAAGLRRTAIRIRDKPFACVGVCGDVTAAHIPAWRGCYSVLFPVHRRLTGATWLPVA